jgi:hypothetical protein
VMSDSSLALRTMATLSRSQFNAISPPGISPRTPLRGHGGPLSWNVANAAAAAGDKETLSGMRRKPRGGGVHG